MSIEDIQKNMEKIKKNARAGIKKSVYDCVLDLQGESQRRAPVDQGDLRGSASNKVSEDGNKITGIVGFAEDYALKQHETLFFNHPKGGEAKYLEKPLMEKAGKYKQHIADAVVKAVKDI